MYAEADIVGGGGSSFWSALIGIPTNINTLAVGGTPSAGQVFQWSSATTGSFINTPAFIQNFSYSALVGLPNAVAALSSLTPASGQIVEYTGAGTAHMITTPTSGSSISTPGTTHVGSLVTWNSTTGAAIADPNIIPSSNGYSLISSTNYASMRGLLGIGSVGLLSDLSSILVAGTNVTLTTAGTNTTINATISGGGATNTTFIGSTTPAQSSGTSGFPISLPAGSNTGDLALVYSVSQTQPIAPAGWTTLYSGGDAGTRLCLYLIAWKVLSNSDIVTGSITITGGTGSSTQALSVYRGPNNASIVGQNLGVDPSPGRIAGFTKQTSNIGTVAVLQFGQGTPPTFTAPASPFTDRVNNTTASNAIRTADAIGGSVYVNGTNIDWTWTGVQYPNVYALELRNDGLPPGTTGVSSVNTRAGAITLTAPDVLTGFGLQMNGLLAAGSGASLSYNSGTGVTTISATGGGGGVSSYNTRTGAVTSVVGDISSLIVGGTNVTVTNTGTQLSISATAGGGGVSAFNGRTGSVTFAAGDVYPVLSAGTGISLSNLGSSVQITASGGGGVPIGYYGAAENSILTSNSASTNVTNLNNLITTLNSGGGGTIWFNGSGAYAINGTINLKSNVSIIMSKGSYISWTGSTSGTVFTSLTSDVLNNCNYQINVTEGSSFTGIVLRLHSHYNCNFDVYAFGIETSAGTFAYLSSDSGAGTGVAGTRNTAFNQYHFTHMGTVGSGLVLDGLASGLGGNPQVNTDLTFNNTWFANALTLGIRLENWSDTITFSGYTYVQASGAGSVGFIVNEAASGTPSVYNIHIEQMAIDTFGTVSPGRYGVFLNQSKGITCDQFYQGPTAELGDIVGTLCTSYQFRQLCSTTGTPSTATADQIVYRQKGIASPAL